MQASNSAESCQLNLVNADFNTKSIRNVHFKYIKCEGGLYGE